MHVLVVAPNILETVIGPGHCTPLLNTPMSAEQPPSSPFLPPIDKSPPRPAPTKAYSWNEYNSHAKLLYIREHGRANKELANLDDSVLGFDLEWKPNYHKGRRENPVALVQLASYDTILLLQISAMEGRSSNLCKYIIVIIFIEFPSKLAEILANSDIVKTGVAIQS